MKKEPVVIDLLKEDDNEAILDLSHRCPQHGIISGYPDRSPHFNRIHKQLSDKSYHMVARKGKDLIGAFGAIFTNLHYQGQEYDSAYLPDFKVDPAFRSSTTAFRVVKETVSELRRMNTQMAIASFLKDNEYSLIFTRSRAGLPFAKYLGDISIFSVIPIFKKRIPKGFEIGHPTEDDIPELVELYNTYYARFKLAPRMTEKLLRFYLGEIDGMGLEQLWIARQDGRIKAALCAWDEDHYKRWYVTRMSGLMKFFSFTLKTLGIIMKMPAPLKEGHPLNHISLVLAAHDNSISGMKALLRSINNYYRGKRYTILQTHFNQDDPTIQARNGLPGFNITTEAYVFTEDPDLAKQIADEDGLVHFEWPMFI